MLAPVLARLARIPGLASVRVECTGTWFLLEAADAAALERALPAVREVLGPSARPADAATAAAQLAARARGELWFSPDGIRGLSYVEGRVLATRVTDAVTAKVPLDRAASGQVHEAARLEIFAALEHAHDTGGRGSTGWFHEAWPGIVEAIVARLDALPPGVRSAVADALRAAA